MSDSGHYDTLGTLRASIRNHLGQFADIHLQARLEIAKKLKNSIANESDPATLVELMKQLNDTLLSYEDITQMEAKVTKVIDTIKSLRTKYIEAEKSVRDSEKTKSGRHHDNHPHFPHSDNKSHN